jgi:hypothetical protein
VSETETETETERISGTQCGGEVDEKERERELSGEVEEGSS